LKGSQGDSVAKDTDKQVEAAIAALDEVRNDWLKRTGVTGVDVGFLWKDGVMTDVVGIRVKVREVLEPENVPDGELFPQYHRDFRVQVLEEAPPTPQRSTRAVLEGGIHHAEEASTEED